jgi:hypothetical protein
MPNGRLARAASTNISTLGGHPAVIASLKAKSRLCRATATSHRTDFERERERAERLAAEVLKATADTMAVKEATAWLEGELAALRWS